MRRLTVLPPASPSRCPGWRCLSASWPPSPPGQWPPPRATPIRSTELVLKKMRKDGSLKETSVKHCQVPTGNQPVDKSWYAHEPLYLQWKEWNCKSECRYHCMMESESEKEQLGLGPVKYHGKWSLKRASVFQEPISAALSALALLVQFNGWLSVFLLLSYKLPLRPETHKTYYEYTGLWHIYGLLSMNAWFWRAIYHSWFQIASN